MNTPFLTEAAIPVTRETLLAMIPMLAMPGNPDDCKEMLALLRKHGLTPEWADKAERKIADEDRERAWLAKRQQRGGAR